MSRLFKEGSIFQKKPSNKSKEKSLKEGRLEMLEKHQRSQVKFPAMQTCHDYSQRDIARCVNHEMPEMENIEFINHLGMCSSCKQTYDAFHYIDAMENKRLQTKAMAIMDAIDQNKSKSQARIEAAQLELMQIMICGSRNSFQLLATTGELLNENELLTRKLEKDRKTDAGPIKIRQEFTGSKLAVLIKLSQNSPWRINFCVVVYNRSTNDFVPRIKMSICKENEFLDSIISDDSGEASFNLDVRENYNIKLFSGNDLLGHILLSAEKQKAK